MILVFSKCVQPVKDVKLPHRLPLHRSFLTNHSLFSLFSFSLLYLIYYQHALNYSVAPRDCLNSVYFRPTPEGPAAGVSAV
jgi:hypothetical protein